MKDKHDIIEYCTYDEFAKRISCSKRFVVELAAQGVIPKVKLGRRCVRIPLQRALERLRELET